MKYGKPQAIVLGMVAAVICSGCSAAAPNALRNTAVMPDQPTTQTVSVENEGITQEEAYAICLENAGVAAEDAFHDKVEQDRENGNAIYDVEFETNYGDYQYEVTVEDGTILEADYEVNEAWARQQEGTPMEIEAAASFVANQVPGATTQDVQIWEEWDDGQRWYEGRLEQDGIIYEFEIDSDTGMISQWKADYRG